MLHMTTMVDDRIRDLHETAAELRHGRTAGPDRRMRWAQDVRLRVGTVLLAAGMALVSGARPATTSRAGR